MKHILWGSFLVLLLAACGTTKTDLPQVTNTFNFTIDPAARSVKFVAAPVAGLTTQAEDGSRVLVPGKELSLQDYTFAFLPGNILQINASFKNVSLCNFSDLSFSARSSNVVSTTEPTVTDADLGGDGVLSAREVSSPLQFQVNHKGQAFTYEVQADATVDCPPVALADLGISVQTSETTVTLGENIVYTATVTNNGPDTAQNVVVTAETSQEAQLVLTDEAVQNDCNYDNSFPGTPFNRKLACGIGSLAPGEKKTVTFTAETLALGVVQSIFEVAPFELTPSGGDPNDGNNGADGADVTVVAANCTNPVNIPDDDLRQVIRGALEKPDGAITCADMASLTQLQASGNNPDDINRSLENLEGLQFATNLTSLSLTYTSIKDLSPLQGLTQLTRLNLFDNGIEDIRALGSLTNLTTLNLGVNSIGDLNPLSSLTNLTSLELPATSTTDISALSSLTNLSYLNLAVNGITDISALVSNMGIGDGDDQVDLTENCLDTSPDSPALADIATIEARNPEVSNVLFNPQNSAIQFPSVECKP